MLTEIELKNFQKHLHLFYPFSEGLNLIVGQNWSGKSSLLRAVRVALFGVSAGKVKAEGLTGPDGPSWWVGLSFQLKGREFFVERSPRKALLTEAGRETPLASGHSAVTAEIESLIGSASAFLTFQVALQGEADTLLTLGAAKLAAHIESVIGSDVVDRVLERIRTVRAPLAAVNEAQTVEWSGRLLEAQTQHAEKLSEMGELYEQICNLARHIPAAGALLAAQQVELASLMQQANAYAQRERELVQLATRKGELVEALLVAQTRLACSSKGEDPAQVFTELQSLSEAKQRYDTLRAQCDTAQQAAESAQAQLDALPKPDQDALPQLRNEVIRREAALQELQQEAAVSEAGLAAHRKMLADSNCPTCHRPFDGHDPAQLATELEQLEEHAFELMQRRNELLTALEGYREAVQGLEQRDARRQDAWLRWQDLSKAAHDAASALSQLSEVDSATLEAVTARYQEASAASAALLHARSVAEGCEQALAQIELQIATLPNQDPVSEAQLTEAKQACSEREQELNRAKLEDATLRERYAALTEALGRLSNEIASLQEKLAEASKTKVKIALLDRLSKYLRANRDRFTEHAWNSVLEFASACAWEGSGGGIEALVRTEEGKFCYREGGAVRDIELASGMQTSILGVGLKLALAAAVNSPFSGLLFDEVSAAASEENALRMTQELAASGSQILLVSHRDSDAAAAASVIHL